MILLFDLGATNTRLALASNGELGDVVKIATDRSTQGFARLMGEMEALAAGQSLWAVVGGVPAQIEGDEGRLELATNLPDWEGLPVRAQLERLFDCPVELRNDVVMAGLGEAHAGAGSKHGVMAYFTISTGANAVRLVDGRVDETIKRYTVGNQIVFERGAEPVDWESLVGGAATQQHYGKPPEQIHARAVWQGEDRHVAYGLYNTILHWAPETVVMGGSMMRDIDLKAVQIELEKLPAWTAQWPKLVRGKLGDRAGLEGALWCSQQRR
jgi:predicted NBD/HSP70 family sugar kinase